MKSGRLLGVAVFAGLLLASCASVAHVEKDDTVNFSRYKTYAWAGTGEQDKNHKNDLQARHIRSAVDNELARQGWREVKNKPDVVMDYDVQVENKRKESNDPMYSMPFTRTFFNPWTRRWGTVYYPSQFMGYDRYAYDVKQGTLTLTMLDTRSDRAVWQGWTTTEVNSKNLTSKEIQASVKSIFKKFDTANK